MQPTDSLKDTFGLTMPELLDTYQYDFTDFGGESSAAVKKRVADFLEDIKTNGKFDPQNGDHIILRNLIMKDRGIDQDGYNGIVNATIGFAKRATPAVNFHPVSVDHFDGSKGVFFPAKIDNWFDELEDIIRQTPVRMAA